MNRNKHILSVLLLLMAIIFSSCPQCIAVVPYPLSVEETSETRTQEGRLVEIIEKLEEHEKANIKFFYEIEKELKQILKKEGNGNER